MWRNHSAEGQNSMTFSKSPGLTCVWHLEKLAVKAYHFKKEASPSNAGLAKRIYNLSSHTSVGDNLTPHIKDATQASDKLRRQRIYWLTRICLYQSCFAGSCNTMQHCNTASRRLDLRKTIAHHLSYKLTKVLGSRGHQICPTAFFGCST